MKRMLGTFAGIIFVAVGLWVLAPAAQPSRSVEEITKHWRASPHANAASESFAHWDKQGKVPARCATCHSGEGFRDFVGADGSAVGKVDKPAPIRSVVGCNVCHNPQTEALARVTLPSGFTVEKPGANAACLICHQGRASGLSVTRAVAGLTLDVPSAKLRFINIHYRAAAATMFGSHAQGGFQYPNKKYHGAFQHPQPANTCAGCHDAHSTQVKTESCGSCHNNAPLRSIRTVKTDFDGDGNTSEGVHSELATMHEILGKAIGSYSKSIVGTPILYDSARYPYFFTDKNGNGQLDKDEVSRKNAYASWTPRLLQAAYNYQYVAKEPGMYAHNPAYGLQLLYDSIASLNERAPVAEFSKLKRP